MPTISISESTRKKLLSIAADLQKEYGERVDFNRLIDHLTDSYESKKPRLEYWDQFTKGIPRVKFETLTKNSCGKGEETRNLFREN